MSRLLRSSCLITTLYIDVHQIKLAYLWVEKIMLQWKLLNVTTDNVFIWLMWSNQPSLTKSQITISLALFLSKRLLIVIIQLLFTLWLCPKVITLSGFHCAFSFKWDWNHKLYLDEKVSFETFFLGDRIPPRFCRFEFSGSNPHIEHSSTVHQCHWN